MTIQGVILPTFESGDKFLGEPDRNQVIRCKAKQNETVSCGGDIMFDIQPECKLKLSYLSPDGKRKRIVIIPSSYFTSETPFLAVCAAGTSVVANEDITYKTVYLCDEIRRGLVYGPQALHSSGVLYYDGQQAMLHARL